MQAFYDLSSSRTITMGGEGPIPVSEIVAYCELDGITDPDDRIEFMRAIRAMDSAYLTQHRKTQEREKEGEEKPRAKRQQR